MTMINTAINEQQNKKLKDIMETALSCTPIKKTDKEGNVYFDKQPTIFYLRNDIWPLSHFLNLEQFAVERDKKGFYKNGNQNKFCDHKLHFEKIKNEALKLEAKFIFHEMIYSGAWTLFTTYLSIETSFNRLIQFMGENNKWVNSFSEMKTDAFLNDYLDWLTSSGYSSKIHGSKENTTRTIKARTVSSQNTRIPSLMASRLDQALSPYLPDIIPELLWQKDVWSLDEMRIFGIDGTKTQGKQIIHFDTCTSYSLRQILKTYIKEKLMSHEIVWSTAQHNAYHIVSFLNYIHEIHPEWKSLTGLSRKDISGFQEHTNLYATKHNISHIDEYTALRLQQIKCFIEYLQEYEYHEAPKKDVSKLIHKADTMLRRTKRTMNNIKHIPDIVVQQLFDNLDGLTETWQIIVLTMYYTGLRSSDVLELKQNVLSRINGKPFIIVDIRKTKTFDHHIPITEEFYSILEKTIEDSKEKSNNYTNPEGYIFVHFDGINRGKPYSKASLQDALNNLAVQRHIVDENGKLYHFKNHAFRHTFAMRMLNNGASIVTVQDLLAHSSPTMTLVYARLLDNTKYKEFEKAVKNGAFSFGDTEDISLVPEGDKNDDIIKALWLNHKLNAIDTPYGTCLQRKNGKCKFAKQPPCLTCNSGKPCNDLCIGAFQGDKDKYDILIKSTEQLYRMAIENNREDMAKENKEQLLVLKRIKSVLDEGGFIFGRIDRLKEKQ